MRFLPVLLSIVLTPPALGHAQTLDTGWDSVLTDYSADDIARLRGTVSYEIPELYELATIVISLTPGGNEFIVDSEYALEVRDHFGPFSNHPLVTALGINTRRDDWFKAYDFRENAYVFCFDASERIVRCLPYSHAWGRQSNSFARNLDLISDFVRVSGFREFYRAHQSFYAEETEIWRRSAPVPDMQTWLEQRFPERLQHYAVVYSPLVRGWHSTQGFSDEGLSAAVLFLQSVRGTPQSTAARIVFTEIDHNYVNRATERFIERHGPLVFAPEVWSTGASNAYASANTIFDEYMTWSVFLLWVRDYYPPDTRDEAVEVTTRFMVERRGFLHFAAFDAELARLYARQRGRKDIPALYPALMRWAAAYEATHRDPVDH